MIRWYDYPASLLMANLILNVFFTVPVVGAIIAYVIYEHGWNSYCEFRLRQENE